VNLESFRNNLPELRANVYLTKTEGPIFFVNGARLGMSNKECVKNIMNLVYESIPHLLIDSSKNTQVKHIGLTVGGSKNLPIYSNEVLDTQLEQDTG
jgi:hypothetical protein